MKFRTDISFLRAIAVLMVMFFHFQIVGFSGGFIGVDVFFVISGFLMTQITLTAFDKDNFSLKDFYIKRTKRIVPAMQVMILFVLLVSIFVLFKSDIKLNGKYSVLAQFFSTNIYFWLYQNYFTSGDNILLHTWSLGVEWQFYLLYPLLLIGLRKLYLKKQQWFWLSLLLVTLSSFVLMLVVYKNYNDFSFYMLPTRFWELSIGGLAFAVSRLFSISKSLQKTIVLIMVFIIFLGCYLISESIKWPSFYTLVPVVGTFFILSINLNTRVFNNAIIKYIGDISYSLYLWHWPWFILFKNFGFTDKIHYKIMLIIISFLSAILSYKYIEINKRLSSFKFIGIMGFVIVLISTVSYFKPSILYQFSVNNSEAMSIVNYTDYYINNEKNKQFNPCGCYETYSKFNFKSCLSISSRKKNVLLLGDSHMAQFSKALREFPHYNWLEISTGYTLPVMQNNGMKDHRELMDYAYKNYIPENKNNIDLVIISAHWNSRQNADINWTVDETLTQILKTIEFLDNNNIAYLVVGQTESYTLNYPRVLMISDFFNRDVEDFVVKGNLSFNNKLRTIIPKENYIDIYDKSTIVKFDKSVGIPYMFDNNHLTSYGADQYVKQMIMPKITTRVQP